MMTSSFPHQGTLSPKVNPWHVPEQFPLIFNIILFKTDMDFSLWAITCSNPLLYLTVCVLCFHCESVSPSLTPWLFLCVISRHAPSPHSHFHLNCSQLSTVIPNNPGKHPGNWTTGQFHWGKNTDRYPSPPSNEPVVRVTWKPLLCSIAQWPFQSWTLIDSW